MKHVFFATLCVLIASIHLNAFAQTAPLIEVQILDFRETDQKFIDLGLSTINSLTQQHFGSSLNTEPTHDLALLQRLLDKNIIQSQDRANLQAMGIAFGEVLRGQKYMQWVRYHDQYGQSRALQLKHTDYVVFPITLISRRAVTGLSIDVAALYKKTFNQLELSQQVDDYY